MGLSESDWIVKDGLVIGPVSAASARSKVTFPLVRACAMADPPNGDHIIFVKTHPFCFNGN